MSNRFGSIALLVAGFTFFLASFSDSMEMPKPDAILEFRID